MRFFFDWKISEIHVKGRFLEFRKYHNFGKIILKIVGKLFLQRNKQVSVKSIELKALDWPFCEGFPNSAAHIS